MMMMMMDGKDDNNEYQASVAILYLPDYCVKNEIIQLLFGSKYQSTKNGANEPHHSCT
jgi:hypothetical protein